MLVSRDIVRDKWDLPHGGTDDVEVIEDVITGHSRWSVGHLLTVRIKDKFYQTSYSVGATECQDESPWEYEKEVEFTEVHQVAKVVKVWETISGA